MRKVKNPPLGESFDEFLKEEGIFEAVQETAIKRVRAWQLEEAMKAQRLDPSRAGHRGGRLVRPASPHHFGKKRS